MHKAHYSIRISLVQSGRTEFRLGESWKALGKAKLHERSQVVTSFVHEQEEETR